MFDTLSFESYVALSRSHARVVVYREIMGDHLTPVHVFMALKSYTQGGLLLESNPKDKSTGRYSFLGFSPFNTLVIKEDDKGEILDQLRDFYQANRAEMIHRVAGFAGGIAGFMTYDAVQHFEPVLASHKKHSEFPIVVYKAYRDHVLFDQETGQVVLATVVETDLKENYEKAMKRLNTFHDEINAYQHETNDMHSDKLDHMEVNESMDDTAYTQAASKAKSYIQSGDAFQIVLSRSFETSYTADPFDIYRVLRHRNPSPYMFYIMHDEYVIAGASPEIMVSVKDHRVQSCPLAGTRPRGEGYDDDTQIKALLSDEKEVSEHMMLVDLARNDLGVVAETGTVKITALKHIKKFAHVMHVSSTVEAELKQDKDAFDALRASFPAGTLSGAPKIRAMQIIDELEPIKRGLYGGTIGFMSSRGDFDSCIAIRMAVLNNGKARVTTGAGIVADSDLQKEADETRHKAKTVLEAIRCANRGMV